MFARLITLALLATLARASITKREIPEASIQPSQTLYHSSQPGIQLQSGSISYLVPDPSKSGYINTIGDLVVKEGILEKIKAIVPAVTGIAATALGKVVEATLAVVTVGVTFGAIVYISSFFFCKFTSICHLPSISITSYGNEYLEEAVRAYMAPDKLTALSDFVINSIEKFSKKYKHHQQE